MLAELLVIQYYLLNIEYSWPILFSTEFVEVAKFTKQRARENVGFYSMPQTRVGYQSVRVSSRRCCSEGRHCGSACRQPCYSSSTASRCWRTRDRGGCRPCAAWSTWSWSIPECWEERAASGRRADEPPTSDPQTLGKLSSLNTTHRRRTTQPLHEIFHRRSKKQFWQVSVTDEHTRVISKYTAGLGLCFRHSYDKNISNTKNYDSNCC